MAVTVKEIVSEYLKTHGFGGLQNDDCGCFDNDLMPCDSACEGCEASYKVPAHCETCETGCDNRDDKPKFCLTNIKPE